MHKLDPDIRRKTDSHLLKTLIILVMLYVIIRGWSLYKTGYINIDKDLLAGLDTLNVGTGITYLTDMDDTGSLTIPIYQEDDHYKLVRGNGSSAMFVSFYPEGNNPSTESAPAVFNRAGLFAEGSYLSFAWNSEYISIDCHGNSEEDPKQILEEQLAWLIEICG